MALPDLTGINIEDSYQRVVHTDGTDYYDGTGSLLDIGGTTFPYTGSAIISGALNVIGEFTASGFNYPTVAGVEGDAIVVDQDGNLIFASPKAVTERVKNVSGGELPKGTPVHATSSGTEGNIVGVIAADAGDPTKMPATYVLNETLTDEAEGEALAVGYIQGVDTRGLVEGEVVYVGVGGGWTQTKPTGSALIQNLGVVTKVAQNGSGVVLGAGRSNDVPNLQPGYAWIGNDDWTATAVPTSSFNEDPFPYTGSAVISGSLEVIGNVTGSLTVESSGSTVFEVIGSEGQLFSITDSLSGSLFAVSDVSGLPILEVFSDDTVKIGSFNNEAIIVTGSTAIISGSFSGNFQGDGSNLTGIETDPFPYTGSAVISGSLEVIGTQRSLYTTQSFQYSGSNLTQITMSFENGGQEITNINYTGSNIDNIVISGSDGINKIYTLSYDGDGNVTNIVVS